VNDQSQSKYKVPVLLWYCYAVKRVVTWSRIARLIEEHPAVKKVRLDADRHRVTIGFYESPSREALDQIQQAVSRELSGEWNVSVVLDGEWPSLHLHKVDEHTAEIHRNHPANEPPVIWRRIPLPGWRARPFPALAPGDYRIMLALAAVCGVSTLTGFLAERAAIGSPILICCFALAYLSGGWFTTQDVWAGLRRGKVDIHFLMIAVAFGALFVRAWTEGATLLFLFSLSNGLEQFANHRTRKTIESLLKTAPKLALRRRTGGWDEIPIEQVRPGDELLVKPGELFPVDGVVIEGATSADESALTGESIPVAKQIGNPISGGTLNLDGQTVIRTIREPGESALNRIVTLINLAQEQKAPTQRFTDTFSRYYTWVALSLGATVFISLLLLNRSFNEALYRAMTVLVVASPCALVLSIPSAILVAIAAGARRGILFRGGVAVENLAAATLFAFDKTGTLTRGNLVVSRVTAFPPQTEGEVIKLATAIATFSTHPLARALVLAAENRGLTSPRADDFLNVPGLGMEAVVNGKKLLVGSRRYMLQYGLSIPPVETTAEAEVWVGGDRVIGVINLRDEIRPAARGVIDFLKKAGVRVTLLTGDRAEPAAMVASEVGIDDVRAELSPQAKLQSIHELRAAGNKVAMVGDGINDAPSLTAADVSIGMGARGSDAALEQADVILMHDKIENVEEAFRLSSRARSIIRQNITISLGVIFILIISALLEKISLTLGVIGHEGSTVLVILNGLRLLRSSR
jgi:Cd2+/Zn2+-exporting ATPase